jgi:isopenicillin-N epimerase
MMERRGFLKGLVAALAVAHSLPEIAHAVTDYLRSLADDLSAAPGEPEFWSRVGDEFLLEPGRLHFNTGSIGATPRAIIEAYKAYIDRLEENPYGPVWSGFPEAQSEAVLGKASAFLGRPPGNLLLTRNTSEGMNLVATGIRWQPGDEVLTTDHEHAGGMNCWLHMEHMADIKVRQIHLPTPVIDRGEILQRIEDGITDRTRVVSVSHINTTTGLVMPLADIAEITRPRGIFLVCDGAQAPGMLDVDLENLKVDTYASSSHKWMLAPKGTGLLYVRGAVGRDIRPVSASMGATSTYGVYMNGGGTRNTPLMLAHGDTMDFHSLIGRPKIEARVRQLNAYLRQRLSFFPNLTPVTPGDPELSGAMVAYKLNGISVRDLYSRLAERRIIIKQTGYNWVVSDNPIPNEREKVIRLSTHIFNDENQIDQLVESMASIMNVDINTDIGMDAGSTPESFGVHQNHPNPFNANTQISYDLARSGDVEVAVFNSRGQAEGIISSGWQEAGAHQLTWDAGSRASGTYYYEVRAGAKRVARKMVLLK